MTLAPRAACVLALLAFASAASAQPAPSDQLLADQLDAYGKTGSPPLLLEIAATLRELGRLSDAANTYRRYLREASGPDPAVRDLVVRLDEQLTQLHVHVEPSGSDISIDGGPFVRVGQRLVTRVRPGLHLVRIRNAEQTAELTVHGFEGEAKQVRLRVEAPPATGLPDEIEPWLTNGTQYTADSPTGRVRRTHSGFAGAELAPTAPPLRVDAGLDGGPGHRDRTPSPSITTGAIGVVRIDGKLRGFAGGLGLAVARGRFEADLLALRSDTTGAYLGVRVRLLGGRIRPYVAAGVPAFLYDDAMDTTKVAVGVRAAGGIELRLTTHVSLQGDLGYEHFFGVEDTAYEADVFVPTVGVVGRL